MNARSSSPGSSLVRLASASSSSSQPSFSRSGLPSTWFRSASIWLASSSNTGTLGTNTLAVSPGWRARTNRPTAWAKNSGVEALVAYTPTASLGTSTPSLTIRTATSQRASEAAKSAIRPDAFGSSESTTVGSSSAIVARIFAYAFAESWSEAMTSPPASGMPPARNWVSRVSAARSTAGIHSPPGSRAVRQARAVCSAVIGSPSRAVNSSPALVRQLASPE